MPKYVPGLLGLYDTLMPRHPGTPVPSWPGTFCCGLQYSGSLGSQVPSRAAATDKVHLTSPRRSTRNSQVRPPHGPPPGLHVRVAQIIHEQGKRARATGRKFQSALHGAANQLVLQP